MTKRVGWLMLLSVLILGSMLSGCSSSAGSGIPGNGGNGGGNGGSSGGTGKLYVAGWLRTIAIAESTIERKASFFKNIRLFDEINPVWYDVTYVNGNNGTKWDTGTCDQDVVERARQYGVKIVPTLGNVWLKENGNGAEIVNQLIGTEADCANHVQDIVQLVERNGFDGIDINYENVGTTAIQNNNKQFTNFISLLGRELDKVNKSLSVCVYRPGVSWQEWGELLKYVDALKVMVYDCDITNNPVPLPICQLNELRRTLNYARNCGEVAKGKIIIGLPFYGRHWKKKKGEGNYSKSSMLYFRVRELMESRSIIQTQVLRGQDDEPYFTYTDSEYDEKTQTNVETEHTVYFQDAQALRTRLELINQYRDVVKGVTFWELGGEDPAVWNEIARYRY